MTNNNNLRFGEPEIAVNPRNPNNIVYYVMSNRLTYQCEAANNPDCSLDSLSGTPLGESAHPGWLTTHIYVTFDHGRTWRDVTRNLAAKSSPVATESSDGTHKVDHSDLMSRGDPMVTVTANGTFYIGWDAMHLGPLAVTFKPGFSFGGTTLCPATTPPPGCKQPVHGLVDGGIAVSKSTDGGRTWSTPHLTGTGVDRPWMTSDLSTGRIYEASSGSIDSSMSTGDPSLPIFSNAPTDRYVVSSINGANWTQPEGLGGGGFSGSNGSTISAANGHLAAAFSVAPGNDAACQYFLSNVAATSPCTIFETSTSSGSQWSRHPVPGLANAAGSIQVAADPVKRGTYTVAATDPTSTTLLVYVTHDSGKDWAGPAVVNDGSSSCPSLATSPCKFKLWISYSPEGVLGLAWRSANVSTGAASTTNNVSLTAYSEEATVSNAADAVTKFPCDLLGCGLVPDDPNDADPAPVPYTMWAATSKDAGATFSQPLQISRVPSAPADPHMLVGTDDTSVIALSSSDVLVGWGQWPTGTQGGLPMNVAGYLSAVKLPAFTHR